MTHTYWLSFADGSGFLGAAVVDVTDEDAAKAIAEMPHMHDKDQGPWIVAATREAWAQGINPGGEVLAVRLTPERAARLPRGRLLNKAEALALTERRH